MATLSGFKSCLGSKVTRQEQEMKGAHTEKQEMKPFPFADGITL